MYFVSLKEDIEVDILFPVETVFLGDTGYYNSPWRRKCAYNFSYEELKIKSQAVLTSSLITQFQEFSFGRFSISSLWKPLGTGKGANGPNFSTKGGVPIIKMEI